LYLLSPDDFINLKVKAFKTVNSTSRSDASLWWGI